MQKKKKGRKHLLIFVFSIIRKLPSSTPISDF